MRKRHDPDQLRTEYKRCFGTADGKAVLRDLAHYCNIGLGLPVNTDPVVVHGIEAMRRVFWHVYHLVYDQSEPAKVAPRFDFQIDPFKELEIQ